VIQVDSTDWNRIYDRLLASGLTEAEAHEEAMKQVMLKLLGLDTEKEEGRTP
jgi:hypothetical protein